MRRGVGRVLVDDLATRAHTAGASYVDVIANPNALGFYTRLGFHVTDETSTRFGAAPRMTLALPRSATRPGPRRAQRDAANLGRVAS